MILLNISISNSFFNSLKEITTILRSYLRLVGTTFATCSLLLVVLAIRCVKEDESDIDRIGVNVINNGIVFYEKKDK